MPPTSVMASTNTLQNSAAERDETDARTIAPSAMPSGILCRATASATARRMPWCDANCAVAIVQPSKKLCNMLAPIMGAANPCSTVSQDPWS